MGGLVVAIGLTSVQKEKEIAILTGIVDLVCTVDQTIVLETHLIPRMTAVLEKNVLEKKDAALRRTSVARVKEIVVVMKIVRMVLFVVKITVKEKRLIRRMIAV